jgi:hypothetical protein
MPINTSEELADLDLTQAPVPEMTNGALAHSDTIQGVVEVDTPVADGRSVFYNSLTDEEAARLRSAAGRITEADRRIGEAKGVIGKNVLVIGRELNFISSKMSGVFEEWLRLEFSMSRASAYHYMNVATEFADVPTILDVLPATTVYKLAARTTPAEVRDAVVREITAGEPVSAKDVKERIADAKAKADDAKRLEAELKEQNYRPAANDDATDKEVAGGQDRATASRLPDDDAGARGLWSKAEVQERKMKEPGQAEQMAHVVLASVRRHLPAEVLETLVACARDDAAWHALGGLLRTASELSAAA